MSHSAKNILIVFLLLIIGFLFYILFDLSYGRYCRPIIREMKPQQKTNNKRSGNKEILKDEELSGYFSEKDF